DAPFAAIDALDDEPQVVTSVGNAVVSHHANRHAHHMLQSRVPLADAGTARRDVPFKDDPLTLPLLALVDHLERAVVGDAAVAGLTVQRVAVAQHFHDQLAAVGHAPGPGHAQAQQDQSVDEDARAQDPAGLAVDAVLRGIADQAARIAHLAHDL